MQLPLPPPEMRALVGPTEIDAFDNPSRGLVFPYLEPAAYEAVFDFGCGCGRIARKLIQQDPQPQRYLGVDLHRGMIEWCRTNLAPHAPQFEFQHHDVFNYHFNPAGRRPPILPLPAPERTFTLVNAFSVFTHLTQAQAEHYFAEVARILRHDGVLHSTWFLFDKRDFPMLQEANAALYVSDVDPSAAVIFDRAWLLETARKNDLGVVHIVPPVIRGYQWVIVMAPRAAGRPEVELPPDESPYGDVKLPDMPVQPNRIGLERKR